LWRISSLRCPPPRCGTSTDSYLTYTCVQPATAAVSSVPGVSGRKLTPAARISTHCTKFVTVANKTGNEHRRSTVKFGGVVVSPGKGHGALPLIESESDLSCKSIAATAPASEQDTDRRRIKSIDRDRNRVPGRRKVYTVNKSNDILKSQVGIASSVSKLQHPKTTPMFPL